MKEKTVLEKLKQIKTLFEIRKSPTLDKIIVFVSSFYAVEMSSEFYELLLISLKSKSQKNLLKIISTGNIYKLISHLKNNDEETTEIEEYISPQEYFEIPKKHINRLIKYLENMNQEPNELNKKVSEELLWNLRRRATKKEAE